MIIKDGVTVGPNVCIYDYDMQNIKGLVMCC